MAQDSSNAFFQQMMAQMSQQSKWNSPQNLINLATLGLGGIGGLASGAQQGRAAEMTLEQQAYQRAQDAYARRLAGRNGLQGAIMDQLQRRDQAGINVANASPLGWDQQYRQQMAGARAMSSVAENFRPLMPGPSSTVGGFVARTPNVVGAFATPDYRSTISQGATENSIQDRRTVIDGLRADRPDALSRENQLMELLNAQMREAAAPQLAPYDAAVASATQAQPAAKKKGGFWRNLGKVAAIAAPIVAAPFTGGASLALIGAGAGAAGAALNGGGVKGALMGAGMGALTSGIGGGAAGAGAKRVAGESVKSAMQRAIVNPRALTQMGGAALSGQDGRLGQIGNLAQTASMFLPGAKPGRSNWNHIPYTVDGVSPVIPRPADFTSDILAQAARPTPSSGLPGWGPAEGQMFQGPPAPRPTGTGGRGPGAPRPQLPPMQPVASHARPNGGVSGSWTPNNAAASTPAPSSWWQATPSPGRVMGADPQGATMPSFPQIAPSHGRIMGADPRPGAVPASPVRDAVMGGAPSWQGPIRPPQMGAVPRPRKTMSELEMAIQNILGRNGNINLPDPIGPAFNEPPPSFMGRQPAVSQPSMFGQAKVGGAPGGRGLDRGGQVSTGMEINMVAPDGTRVPVPFQYFQQLVGEGWRVAPAQTGSRFGNAKAQF